LPVLTCNCLGAGASIRCGVSGVKGMVCKFIEKLENEQYNLQVKVTKDIVHILNRQNNDVDVDIMMRLLFYNADRDRQTSRQNKYGIK
jgi:hypothetical protein